MNVDDAANDIYDPIIEQPKYQIFISSIIKAWLRDAFCRGVISGREELALELETTIKKNLNPDSFVYVMKK